MPRPVSSHFSLVALAAIGTLVSFLLGAPSGPRVAEAQKKVLNIAAKEPETLDPHTSILGQSQAIFRFMYRGLTRFAIKDGKVTTAEVEPDLAESWTLSPDGTLWTCEHCGKTVCW
jgi:peptide/nickel transport system substrate-binding protein